MKPIQIMMDERLLDELDASEEARRDGRSAVLRKALAEYLGRRRAQVIRERYEAAYRTSASPLQGLEGWEDEGEWPEE